MPDATTTELPTFDAATPRFGLPLLFAAQAQKELFVNEAFALADALLHCVVEGEAQTPPATPVDGTGWLVGPAPLGAWSGNAGKLALRQSGNWLFVTPQTGLRIFDKTMGQERVWLGEWQAPAPPPLPAGGSTIDVEARTAITQLVGALRLCGIFPTV